MPRDKEGPSASKRSTNALPSESPAGARPAGRSRNGHQRLHSLPREVKGRLVAGRPTATPSHRVFDVLSQYVAVKYEKHRCENSQLL